VNRNPLYTLAHGIALALLIAALLPLGALSARAQEGIDARRCTTTAAMISIRTPAVRPRLAARSRCGLRAATAISIAAVRVFNTLRDRQDLVPMVVAATTPDGTTCGKRRSKSRRADDSLVSLHRHARRADGHLRVDQRLDATGRIWPRTRAGRARSTRKAPTSATRSRLRPGLQHAGMDAHAVVYQIFPDRFRNGDRPTTRPTAPRRFTARCR